MKIRSVYLNDFRSFRGEHVISFCDPLTDDARPVAILAGTNGSGKTSILEVIEGLLRYLLLPDAERTNVANVPAVVREAWSCGCVGIELELEGELLYGDRPSEEPQRLQITVGTDEYRPKADRKGRVNSLSSFKSARHLSWQGQGSEIAENLRRSVTAMYVVTNAPFRGGLLHFPSDRRLTIEDSPAIAPPPERWPWVDRVTGSIAPEGSLERYWTWLNYLDLEQKKGSPRQLRTFVELVDRLLGRRRSMYVRQGRVYITSNRRGVPEVLLSQLPSGEKHVLLFVGELVRRARAGVVVIVDEPEISLHPVLQRVLIHYFREYARHNNAQFLVATHSIEIAKALPTSVWFLDQLHAESAIEHTETAGVGAA